MADRGPVVVTAVLPSYRQEFLRALEGRTPITFLAGDEHCDPSVRTGARADSYTRVNNRFLLRRRLFVQRGAYRRGVAASVAVVDLNPRSLTSWTILLSRAALRRRTLVWGHLFPRSGAQSRTTRVRHRMARQAQGLITYTWDERQTAERDLHRPTWAATNALYTRAQLGEHCPGVPRDLLYVGRLEPAKKVDLVIRAFALARNVGTLLSSSRLVLVGSGSHEPALRSLTAQLDLDDAVRFEPPTYDVRTLSRYYADSAAAVSGGYAGLQITQSLGFGVPVVLPTGEPHAPEIELAKDFCTYWFDRDNPSSLASALARVFARPLSEADRRRARAIVAERYSAEAMADGFEAAVLGRGGGGL